MLGDLRTTHDSARRRLDRARRLYKHLIRRDVITGGDPVLALAVKRAKSGGLYASSVYVGDIASIFVRDAYHYYHGHHVKGLDHWQRWANGHFPEWWNRRSKFRLRLVG